MPRGDGTGPAGPGQGGGQGRMGGPFAAGPGGSCVCLKCGHTIPHQQGVPCSQVNCPKCGNVMSRKRY